MLSITAEHRCSPRHQIDCLIKLEPLDAAAGQDPRTTSTAPSCTKTAEIGLQSAIVQDASTSGARIWADRPYAPNEQLLIHFGCAKVGLIEECSCRATVVWADPEPVEQRWQIGIRFHKGDASDAIVRALVRGCLWCEKLCPDIAAPPSEMPA
ncbi:PilZ domain protein [Thiorhodovibrio winogradskyi]|uniref:PilZ domain protein n=1 Tax=Thiorhodovibrio winogradskyi TaxID=77007 RepID=A0ABZ0S3G8_9GAMM|nr:PilZ domain-containing protein [Thiorhodovibrio winogradskyi]